MRRFRPRQPGPLFRPAELVRLLSMLVFMAVLVTLMGRMRNPALWRFFGGGDELPLTAGALAADEIGGASLTSAAAATEPREAQPSDAAAPPPRVDRPQPAPPEDTGPNETDRSEWEAAEEEFLAITDKDELRAPEMPAYWRLMGWQQGQTFDQLQAKSKRDVYFTHLFQRPEEYRGKLIRLPVRLVRSLTYPAGENSLGIKQLYEAWGASDESYPEPYCLVFATAAGDFPVHHEIDEEAVFCGYFLKNLAYRSRDDKARASPVLIGKLLWRQRSGQAVKMPQAWLWGIVGFGALAALILLKVGVLALRRRPMAAVRPISQGSGPTMSVDEWLQEAPTSDEGDEDADSTDDLKTKDDRVD